MESDLLSIHPAPENLAYLNGKSKRFVDIVGALVGIIFCMPIFVIATFVVKLVDKVPVLFFQERIGFHGKPFVIVKLRTFKNKNSTNTIHSKN